MKNKRVIAIVLSASVLLTSVGTVFASVSNGKLTIPLNVSQLFTGVEPEKSEQKSTDQLSKTLNLKTPDKLETIKLTPDEGDVLYKGTKQSLDKNSKDKYNFDENDVRELLTNGYTIQDIFKADEIANRIDEDSKSLLERKKESKKDLNTIEKDIKAERIHTYLEKLKNRHLDEYNKLAKEDLSEEEQFTILGFFETNDVSSIDQVIKEYKKSGDKGFRKLAKQKVKKISDEKASKYNLTDADTTDVSDEEFKNLEEIANSKKLDVKVLLKGLKNQREESKGAK